ncbi:MAG: DUF488 family protein [Halobacteriales archaeon]
MAAVHETYAAALQHDKAELPPGTRRVGVVRRPMGWFHGAVDENRPELGPPDELLDAVKQQQAAFEADGLDDLAALRKAWTAVDFADRYEQYLDESEAAGAAIGELVEAARAGTDIALVCYESAEKPCHRHLLLDRLRARLEPG